MNKIYVQTLYNNNRITIGQYNSSDIPRLGERISFHLTSMPLTPDGQQLPYEGTIQLRVTDIMHVANNTKQTEDWIVPFSQDTVSTLVVIEVVPASYDGTDPAYQYIERWGNILTDFGEEEEE